MQTNKKHTVPSGPSCTASGLLPVMHQVAHGITCLRRGPGFESPATCTTFLISSPAWICWSTFLRCMPLCTQPQVHKQDRHSIDVIWVMVGWDRVARVLMVATSPPGAATSPSTSMAAVGDLNDYVKYQLGQGMATGGGGGGHDYPGGGGGAGRGSEVVTGGVSVAAYRAARGRVRVGLL